MGIENYKLDIDKFTRYLESVNGMNMVIDFTALVRSKAHYALEELSALPRSKCCWYVIPTFKFQIESLIETDSKAIGVFFCTDKMLDSIEASWGNYNYLPKHLADDVPASIVFLNRLSEYGKENCLVTGNETEAWRHILNDNQGNIILITDDEVFFFPQSCFSLLAKQFDGILPVTKLCVDDINGKRCKTSSGQLVTFEDILSDISAEGTLYLAKHQKTVVKIFNNEVAEQKLLKIEELMRFSDKKENFAWPEEFVYSVSGNNSIPIGFTMPRMRCDFLLEEIYTLEINGQPISDHARWKIAVSLLAQVLFLYIHGIQLGDYNPNNIGITNSCDVVLMDMDSYVLGQFGTQMKGRQGMPFSVNYSSKKDVIKADYLCLTGTVFQILTDGYWPYFYNEDTGLGEYKFADDGNISEEYQSALDSLPIKLKQYFLKVLGKQIIVDPFELYFLLLENEPEIIDMQEDAGEGQELNESNNEEQNDVKKSFFTRMMEKIKNIVK